MIEIKKAGTTVTFNEENLAFEMEKEHEIWKWSTQYVPKMICEEGEFLFRDACRITHEVSECGTGIGIKSTYEGFQREAEEIPYVFETLVWIEEATGDVYFEWIPVKEEGLHVQKVLAGRDGVRRGER